MSNKRVAVSIRKRNEDLFIAGVEYLSKKYNIDEYTLVTKEGYHITGDTEEEINARIEIAKKIFQK